MASLEDQIQLRTAELFESPAVRLIVVVNPCERTILLKRESPLFSTAVPAGEVDVEQAATVGTSATPVNDMPSPRTQLQRNLFSLPHITMVERYVSLIGSAAEVFEALGSSGGGSGVGISEDDWEVMRFSTEGWDIVGYRTTLAARQRASAMAAEEAASIMDTGIAATTTMGGGGGGSEGSAMATTAALTARTEEGTGDGHYMPCAAEDAHRLVFIAFAKKGE